MGLFFVLVEARELLVDCLVSLRLPTLLLLACDRSPVVGLCMQYGFVGFDGGLWPRSVNPVDAVVPLCVYSYSLAK